MRPLRPPQMHVERSPASPFEIPVKRLQVQVPVPVPAPPRARARPALHPDRGVRRPAAAPPALPGAECVPNGRPVERVHLIGVCILIETNGGMGQAPACVVCLSRWSHCMLSLENAARRPVASPISVLLPRPLHPRQSPCTGHSAHGAACPLFPSVQTSTPAFLSSHGAHILLPACFHQPHPGLLASSPRSV